MTLPFVSPEFLDSFDGTAGNLVGRVSPSGHEWGDLNGRFALDGAGKLVAKDYAQSSRYADVHLTGDGCFGMSAVGVWGGESSVITDSSGLVLIAGASPDRPSTPGSAGIYYNCIHPVFGDWQTGIDIWVDGAGTRLLTYNYPSGPLARDTPYAFGWELTGIILTIYMPDGAVKKLADHRFPAWIGPHLIWQIYNTGHPANQPRYESVAATSELIPGYVPPPPLPDVLGAEVLT